MNERLAPGDIVAISAVASLLGGFFCGAGLVGTIVGGDYWIEYPRNALGSSIFAGFIGLIIALFTAWPLGIAFGLTVNRLFGHSFAHAAGAGFLTSGTLFSIAYWSESLVDPTIWLWIGSGSVLGAALGGLSYYYVTRRVAQFREQ